MIWMIRFVVIIGAIFNAFLCFSKQAPAVNGCMGWSLVAILLTLDAIEKYFYRKGK